MIEVSETCCEMESFEPHRHCALDEKQVGFLLVFQGSVAWMFKSTDFCDTRTRPVT